MIKMLRVTNDNGDSLDIELSKPALSGFVISSISGLGPVKADINTTEIISDNGSLYNSSRIPSRNIVINTLFMSDASIEDIRLKSYKYFPVNKKIKLEIITDNMDVEIEGYVESNEPNIFSKKEGSTISILCPDPFFYSAGLNGVQTTIFSGIRAMFEFPFNNESTTENLLMMSELVNNEREIITYEGDYDVGFTMSINISGIVGDITIVNVNTREQFKIYPYIANRGTGIIADRERYFIDKDEIIVTTVKGHKSARLIRGGIEYNILNAIDKKSDWFYLTKGDNIFGYTAILTSLLTGSNALFTITNRKRYAGI